MLTVDADLLQLNCKEALIHCVIDSVQLDISTWVNRAIVVQVQVDFVRASRVLAGIDDVCNPIIMLLKIRCDIG